MFSARRGRKYIVVAYRITNDRPVKSLWPVVIDGYLPAKLHTVEGHEYQGSGVVWTEARRLDYAILDKPFRTATDDEYAELPQSNYGRELLPGEVSDVLLLWFHDVLKSDQPELLTVLDPPMDFSQKEIGVVPLTSGSELQAVRWE